MQLIPRSRYYGAWSDLPTPTCSNESIGLQHCTSKSGGCDGGSIPCSSRPPVNGNASAALCPGTDAVFGHTAEDPSIFKTKRGFHMLMNAMPGGCHPQPSQGGLAWSRDGIHWSEPRIGAYNETLRFLNGTMMQCRRERPQIILDPKTSEPIGMSSGIAGCTRRFAVFKGAETNWPALPLPLDHRSEPLCCGD